MGAIRRLPLEAAVEVALSVTIVLFAFGSSSVPSLVRFAGPVRWGALLALALLAVACVAACGVPRSVPGTWAAAAALVLLALDSAAWSVDRRLTVERTATLAVLFAAAAALAVASPEPGRAVARVLRGVLAGIGAVALISLLVLALSHGDAVQPATAGTGWRFRGVGQNPNTVPMLLSVGLPLCVWLALDLRRRARWLGTALLLLFSGEIAASGTRGAVVAGFAGAALTAVALGRSAASRLALVGVLAVLAAACAEFSRLPSPAPVTPTAGSSTAPGSAPVKTRGIDVEQVFRLQDELGFPFQGVYQPPAPRTFLGSSGRGQAWRGALDQAANRPVAGYGFGTEERVFVDRFFSFEGNFVENTYLSLLLQLGVAGVVVFVGLLLALAWSAVRVLRSRCAEARLGAAAAGVLLAAALIGVTQSGLLAVGNIAAVAIWTSLLTLPVLAREARAA